MRPFQHEPGVVWAGGNGIVQGIRKRALPEPPLPGRACSLRGCPINGGRMPTVVAAGPHVRTHAPTHQRTITWGRTGRTDVRPVHRHHRADRSVQAEHGGSSRVVYAGCGRGAVASLECVSAWVCECVGGGHEKTSLECVSAARQRRECGRRAGTQTGRHGGVVLQVSVPSPNA